MTSRHPRTMSDFQYYEFVAIVPTSRLARFRQSEADEVRLLGCSDFRETVLRPRRGWKCLGRLE
jgi:hypothetical protein